MLNEPNGNEGGVYSLRWWNIRSGHVKNLDGGGGKKGGREQEGQEGI